MRSIIDKNGVTVIIPTYRDTDKLQHCLKAIYSQSYSRNKTEVIVVNNDIAGFVKLRNQLVKEYKLNYKPHIHVDSVIGWSFLMFNNYNFEVNELEIEKTTLEKLKLQSKRISAIKLADSWGIDFHKGIGSCPIPCSVVMINDNQNLATLLQENEDGSNLHQLAQDFSFISPVSYTLETSRPGGAALAALVSLHALGLKGLQSHLANLVQMATLTRKIIENDKNFFVTNNESLGFVTMLQLVPPNLVNSNLRDLQLTDNTEQVASYIRELNEYNENFFGFDKKNRIKDNNSVEYSFSKGYCNTPSGIKISALKLYPTSPLIRSNYIIDTVETLRSQKTTFDNQNK